MGNKMVSLAARGLSFVKSAVFERGNLIYLANIPAFYRSQKKMNKKGDRIRIGFLLQIPENWAVLQSVYCSALADEQFEPVVLLVPEMEYACYIRLKGVHPERIYAFGEKEFGNTAIRTYDPATGEWVDPNSLDLDYVFFTRPYETYLPKQFRAASFRCFCKVCYVPYSFSIQNDMQIVFNTHFLRNVSLIFCEKESTADYVRRKLRPTVRRGAQKVFLCGYPKYDLLAAHSGRESTVWPRERSKAGFRMLWAPRWTTDPRLGGSNFFRYKDHMISWAEADSSIDLVFRPHPLALGHYIDSGLMTADEQQAYLERYRNCPNAGLDRTAEYFDTFFSSDCLITDVSSIIMEYLFTGKPIIYCNTLCELPLNVPGLRECFYQVDSFDEIRETVNQLEKGLDPKKKLRRGFVCRLQSDRPAAEKILQEIRRDYQNGQIREGES